MINTGGSTINNAGVIRSAVGSGLGSRKIATNVNNQAGGLFDVDYDVISPFTSTWTNGTFNVENGKRFHFSGNGAGPTFNQAGGTITTNTTGSKHTFTVAGVDATGNIDATPASATWKVKKKKKK